MATSPPAAVNPVLCSKLGVTVWLENVLSSFCPKEQCRLLRVQKFSLILFVVPKATALSILVGLHWLRRLFVLPEEKRKIVFLNPHHPQSQLKLGYGILRVNSVWCLNASLSDRILEQIKLP